jgi:hypothetical protein
MSTPDRDRRGTNDDKLARLLDTSHLARVVPHLPAETLHQLVRYRGLDSAAELMASATPEQVTSVMDLDLWQGATPGRDEVLDVARFGEWIESLVEVGAAPAGRIVAGLDRRLVIAALSGYLRVFDIGARAPVGWDGEIVARDDAGPLSGLVAELGGFELQGRRAEAWDAIVALLLELEANHPDCFHELMAGCRRLSNSSPEVDGLDDLLTDRRQVHHDAAQARERRRLEQGYLMPAEARALLRAARQSPRDSASGAAVLHAIAAEHLRPRAVNNGPTSGEEAADDAGSPDRTAIDEAVGVVGEVLAEAGLLPGRPRALLAAPADGASPVARMQALMAHLASADDQECLARNRELAFLANALMAGCSLDARAFTVQEASDAVVAACNLGLEVLHEGGRSPDDFLADHDLVAVFHAGWRTLHELSLFVAASLVAVLDLLRIRDLETQLGLHALRGTLERHRGAGMPWLARDALDVIATLDVAAWASLLGLTDECPVVPEALRATLERRTGPVSAKAFEFISSRRQIDEVHEFMGRLVEILVR